MKAAIYARYSSDNQRDSSIEDQVRECKAKASQLGLKVDPTFIYADKAMSGTRTDRPAYRQMLEAAERKEFTALIVHQQSRLGRDGPETEKAIRRLEFHGIRLVMCDGYDTHSMPEKLRKMTRGMKGLMDESFLDDLRENTHRGLKGQAEKLFWAGGKPYGYQLVEITDPKRRDAYGKPARIGSRLESDKEQAKVVREIFERYANGESPQAIAADLNARRVPSPGSTWKRTQRRCGGWARSGIWQMIRNELYSGTLLWNRTRWVKTETGRELRQRPRSEWIGTPRNAPHLAIVSDELWKRVQRRLHANEGKPKDQRLRAGGRAKYLLSGALFCGDCGAHHVLDSATHYCCGFAKDGKACKSTLRVRRDEIEHTVLDPIYKRLLAPEMVAEFAKAYEQAVAEGLAAQRRAASKRPAEVTELEARIARLRARLAAGDPDLTADELQAAIDRAEQKRRELEQSQPAAKQSAKVVAMLPRKAEEIRRQLYSGLRGSPRDAARARATIRQLVGGRAVLFREKKTGRPMVRLNLDPRPLLVAAGGVGSVGSGGRI